MIYSIRRMTAGDVDGLAQAFVSWNKAREQFARYWRENEESTRATFVVCVGERVVGYGNLLWSSHYTPFDAASIPEINDLNVLDAFRKQGIATALISECERLARERGHTQIGIGFGLTPDYGAAQRLYVRLGYVPDGRGVPFEKLGFIGQGVAIPPQQWDEAALYLTKAL